LKERLFTIPVNEAFDADSECPLCVMKEALENNAVDFTMGSSYMEDDIRGKTSAMGFCEKHLLQLYKQQNRLGLALILRTHMDKIIKDTQVLSQRDDKAMHVSLLRKKERNTDIVNYLGHLEGTCFVCDKIDRTFKRYIFTIFYLYKSQEEFRTKFLASKGICTQHYKNLYSDAPKYLSGEQLSRFIKELNILYIDNMKRVLDDLDWFIDKFDYRYADEPWKNAKDALPRAMQKINGITQ
jgi:hypothetical protein